MPSRSRARISSPRCSIVEREGEHALQAIEEGDPPGLVGVQEGFAVGVRGKAMAERFQFGAQFAVVVDFAVGDQREAAVFVVERLRAAFEIDDGEPRMQQAYIARYMPALPVRAAMGQALRHVVEHGRFDRRG